MKTSNKILNIVFPIIFIGSLVVPFTVNASLSGYSANAFSQFCSQNPTICSKVNFQGVFNGSVSCPSLNQIINNVYVHAGQGQSVWELPDSNYTYTFSNNQNTVTVNALNRFALSWIGVVCGSQPSTSPSNSPSTSPSSSPSETPIESQSPDPSSSATPSADPSASASASPTPSATSTPSGSSDNTNSNSSSSSSSSTNSTGQVLGASTMADTGIFETILANILLALGSILSLSPLTLLKKRG